MSEHPQSISWWTRIRWMGIGAALTLALTLVSGLLFWRNTLQSAARVSGPPAGVKAIPWGAIDLDELQTNPKSAFQQSMAESIRSEDRAVFDPDGDGRRDYALLALSGGGANGAYGAGLLCGWSKAGTRPEFKVVTGVSTGALQSTFAFLGPKFDDRLKEVYTNHDTQDIFAQRNLLAGVYEDALHDTSPLEALIARYISADVLSAVAERHLTGHRLFVGTTNMDTREFVVWDMGAIASSGRSDALAHYRKILRASAAIPVLFPPVYFEVEAEGKAYVEMHADGGAFSQVFFRGFLLDFEDAFEDAGIDSSQVNASLYIIRNGQAKQEFYREDVHAHTLSIAAQTIENLFQVTIDRGLYRIYVLANRNNLGFNLAQIPVDYAGDLDPMNFDRDKMRRLFQLGFDLAAKGYDWEQAPPFLDPDEKFDPETVTLHGR